MNHQGESMTTTTTTTTQDETRWIQIDAWGVALAGKQGELDVEVGDWLLAAREAEVHRQMGYGSLAEYVERRMGFTPHAAAERFRVADALTVLPATREALRAGRLAWSVARELTRVAVPETEREWLEAAVGKRAHEVEKLVSGRRPGQLPSDPADPRARRHALHFEVDGETYALWREAVRVMQRNVDPSLSEEEALREMARQVLRGPADEGRSPYQIAITRCEDCGRAWQEGRGEQVEVTPEALERASCDAQHIGSVVAASHVGRPGKATQTIPPAVRRKVVRRDGGRCRVPGCRSSAFLDLHHLRLRSEHGDHDPSRMLTLCGAHHHRAHEGLLLIEGDSETDARFFHADGTEYGGLADAGGVEVMRHAFAALRHMGFGETETKRALAAARSHVGRAGTLDAVVRAGLGVLTEGLGAAM
jgi:hypothetical protein